MNMAKILLNLATTKNLIENAPDHVEKVTRGYLGFSSLGGSCVRSLWLGFRFAVVERRIPVQLRRIFERGALEEKRVITELKSHGIEVFRRVGDQKIEMTGDIGEEQEELVACFGHAKGHPDGRVLGIPEAPKTEHGLEIKTMNSTRWNNFSKKGVKESDPVYYSQVQRLMNAMNLKRFLFIATNKDNEKREYERIYYDEDEVERLLEREYEIITSDRPVGEKFSRTWYECKFCNKYDICHNDAPPAVTCRSCEHVDAGDNGTWFCQLQDNKILSQDEQLKACKSYRRLF